MNKIIKTTLGVSSKPLSITIGLLAILWGGWLLLPNETFTSARVYSVMASLADENLWGWGVFFIGVFQWLAVWSGRHTVELISTSMILFTFLFITVSFVLSNSFTAGIAMFLGNSIIAAWTLILVLSEKNNG